MSKKTNNNLSIPTAQKAASHQKELFLLEPKTLGIVIAISVITLLVSFFGKDGVVYMSSVLNPLPVHAPFDGTVNPIQQVPNWVKLTSGEREMEFASLSKDKIISAPIYSSSRLVTPLDNLAWNNVNDDKIRNEKITYSVPYLGNYKLDGVEGAGSHAAIDIKTLRGTPVVAMANGTVSKTKMGDAGFGNYIVIQHNGVPTLNDKSISTTLHSSYSHLSSVSVQEREVVRKGQLIGFVGDTGAATTPHLHFQIDTDEAYFHPYWPFTGAEQRAAGYSFFEAINKGLGQANAKQYTVNPLAYVQKYYGQQSLVASTQTLTPVVVADPYDKATFKIQAVDAGPYFESSNVSFVVQGFNADGTLLSNPNFTDSVQLLLLNEGAGTLSKQSFAAADLKTGISNQLVVSNVAVGTNKVILRFRNKEFSSNLFEVKKKLPVIAKVLILPQKNTVNIGEKVDIVLRALDQNLSVLQQVPITTEFLLGLSNPIGILDTFQVQSFRFVNGEAKVTFTPSLSGVTSVVVVDTTQQYESQAITVLETIKPVVEATVVVSPVVETPTPEKPAETVVKPESAPIVPSILAPSAPEISVEVKPEVPVEVTQSAVLPVPVETAVNIPPASSVPELNKVFTDVDENSKYYAALKDLKAAGLVAGFGDGSFRPGNTVTRAEAITFILRLVNEDLRKNLTNVFPDVNSTAWYVEYVTTAFDIGFVKGNPDGTFKPDANVTIAEFFTMIFVAAKADLDPTITIAPPGTYDVNAWYAPYIQEAMRKGVLGTFEGATSPERLVTRGEIANVIYLMRNQAGSRL